MAPLEAEAALATVSMKTVTHSQNQLLTSITQTTYQVFGERYCLCGNQQDILKATELFVCLLQELQLAQSSPSSRPQRPQTATSTSCLHSVQWPERFRLLESLSQSFHTPFNSSPICVSFYIPYYLTLIFAINQNIVQVSEQNRGEQNSAVQVSSRVLSSVAGSLYASAILLYDTRLRSVVKAMPWILSAVSCAVLDFFIVFLICYRSNHKRPSVRSLDSDTESLLGDSSVSGQLCNNNVECCSKKHLSARGISPKGTDMGLYMDVNIQPMRKVCLKEVTISRDGSSENLPLKRTVRVVRVDEQCSSGTSTDSSSLGSELEWDFEETKTQWIPVEEAPEDLPKAEAFPLQEWPAGSISKSTGRPGSHICFCNRTQLAKKLSSTQSDK
ncbi:transmembrane protein 44 [Garra rufa]|uniref:transmembrane protein 44 n=1 Tax=Garra rufa TaxID=137080 RepID=UPI003CCE934D